MDEGNTKNPRKSCIGEIYSLRNWGRYAHLSQDILYVDKEGCHVAGLQVPDVPDSEARGISHFPRVDDLVWKKKDAVGSWKTCISGVCGHKNWVLVVVVRKLFLFPSPVGEKLSERKWKNYFNEISLHSLALLLFKTRFSF